MLVRNLDTMLHWEGVSFEGQHVLISDTAQCSGAFLLFWALQRFSEVQFVCLMESPLHYQTVNRKFGGGKEAVRYVKSLEELGSIEDKCVIIDSLYPLQCEAKDVMEVVEVLRGLRKKLGKKGVLVSLFHGDCFAPHFVAYESDVLLSVKEVGSSEVSGRLSVTKREQKEPNELVFTVLNDSVTFKRI
jgi:hypothetical protein